jgi:outer membrane protein OmpA-like peptidoglycan-associated protein
MEAVMALSEDSAGFASSLTDLMTSLAIIFILLLVVSLNNAQQGIDETREQLRAAEKNVDDAQRKLAAAQQKTETTRNQILDALVKVLASFAKQGVKVEPDPKDPLGLLVLVPEGLLNFDFDKSVIPAGGKDFLKAFIPKLAATACSDQFKDEINSIVVEGHTDPSGRDEWNLLLSQNRSMAVVRESLNVLEGSRGDGKASSTLRTCFLTFLSASGRGSAEPIRDQEVVDYPRSRRVVFKIRVRSLEQRQLIKQLGQ